MIQCSICGEIFEPPKGHEDINICSECGQKMMDEEKEFEMWQAYEEAKLERGEF